jgi:hypothetical protein
MVCCLLCFDDSPMDGDPRASYGKKWEIGMMDAPCKQILFKHGGKLLTYVYF